MMAGILSCATQMVAMQISKNVNRFFTIVSYAYLLFCRNIDEFAVNDFEEVDTDLCGLRLRILFTPVTSIMSDAEEAWILAMITGRRQEVKTRGSIEMDGLYDFQIGGENNTWITAVGSVEHGADVLSVIRKILYAVECFGAVVKRHFFEESVA